MTGLVPLGETAANGSATSLVKIDKGNKKVREKKLEIVEGSYNDEKVLGSPSEANEPANDPKVSKFKIQLCVQ